MLTNIQLSVKLPIVKCSKCHLCYCMFIVSMPFHNEHGDRDYPEYSTAIDNENFYCPNCGTKTLVQPQPEEFSY